MMLCNIVVHESHIVRIVWILSRLHNPFFNIILPYIYYISIIDTKTDLICTIDIEEKVVVRLQPQN